MKFKPAITDFLQTFFDRIFFITLERATDRHEKIRRNFEGMPYEFFYGVDKRTLGWEKIKAEKIYDDKKSRKINLVNKSMTIGHIACSLSHRKLYEHILDKGYQRVLIFEDDATPNFPILSHLPDTLRELPEDWELIYLGYQKNEESTLSLKRKQSLYKQFARLRLIKSSLQMIKNTLPRDFSTRLQYAGWHDLAHAYGVTAEACKKLVSVQTPVLFNADILLGHMVMKEKLKAFITTEKFFHQAHTLGLTAHSYINE